MGEAYVIFQACLKTYYLYSPLIDITMPLEDCSICLDTPNNPAKTPCMHVFCRRCIGSWLDQHSACPVCRHRITRGRRALVTVRHSSPRRSSSAPPSPGPIAEPPQPPPRPVSRHPTTASHIVQPIITRSRPGQADWRAVFVSPVATSRGQTTSRGTPATSTSRTATSSARGASGTAASRQPRVTSVAESIATACAARSIRNVQSVRARNNRATNLDLSGQNSADTSNFQCLGTCHPSNRREALRTGTHCPCVRDQISRARMDTVQTTRSEPSSRRASSSSSEDEFAGFCTDEMERAILESVQLASERDVIDLTDDQVNEVAGAEAGAAAGARPRTIASAEGARARTGTSSTATSVLCNADTFLDALQRVVVGSDFDFDMDTSEATQHPDARRSAIFTAMTSMGIGEPVRRLIDRLLSIDTLGGPVGGPSTVSQGEGSFVSLAMVKERLIEQGESRTIVNRLLTSLKDDAINL